MITIFDRGTHIQWKTVDGAVHTGIIKQTVAWGYKVTDDSTKEDVFVNRNHCVKYEEKRKKK